MIDADEIPTGIEADEERIAERIADPHDPLTVEAVPEHLRPSKAATDAAERLFVGKAESLIADYA